MTVRVCVITSLFIFLVMETNRWTTPLMISWGIPMGYARMRTTTSGSQVQLGYSKSSLTI